MIIPNKHDGYGEGGRVTSTRRVFMDGGGGSQSSTSTVYNTNIPEYARPYVEETLGRAYPLITQPFQQYQGERVAQFTPLQQQAFQAAQGLGAAPQMQTASNIAAQAAQQGLGYGGYNPLQYTPGSFAAPGMAQQFMSPYMDEVVRRQQQDARRQADIAGQQQQAQAVRAGAFGGSRDAIMRAEANRALQSQLGNIQAQGQQQAFQQAQQQFNQEQAQRMQAAQLGEQSRQYGAGLGLQGLQAALSGAGQLGQLGGQQFGQNLQALQMQQQLGALQQQQIQNILNQQRQDFIDYQNYPYKQLGFMSDILRGLPLTQQSSTVYQAAPSPAAQIAGLGAIGKGFGMFAEGGEVEEYTPEQGYVGNEAVAKLDNEALQQEYMKAMRQGNEPRLAAIKKELEYRSQRFKNTTGGGSTKPAGLADLAIYQMGE